MNPAFLDMVERSLKRGYDVLILTNAMAPMMRPKIKAAIVPLVETYGDKLTFRISLDHHAASVHDTERGVGTFAKTLRGIDWLSSIGARLAVAGRIEMAEIFSRWFELKLIEVAGFIQISASIPI